MGHNNAVSGHPKSIRISQVDGLSTGPPYLGCHSKSIHPKDDINLIPIHDPSVHRE